jgi:hypothetical protein
MHRLFLIRPVASESPPAQLRPAKVIALSVRREAQNDPRPPASPPDRPTAA